MKFKLAAAAFTIAVITISTYAVLWPSYDLGLFVGLGKTHASIRIIISLAIAAYVLIPFFRLKIIQLCMLIGGGVLLAAGVTSIFSPTLFGYLSHYTTLGDIIMAIEGGTISMLAGLQLDARDLQWRRPFLITPAYYKDKFYSLKPTNARPQSRTA